MDYATRTKWVNDAGNQAAYPLRVYEPQSLDDLVEIVQAAEAEGVCVRAIGSSHSWSDVCVCPDFMMRPTGLTRPLVLDPVLLKTGTNVATLVEVEGGITLRELNAYLDVRGLALPNMGGYDGQTIAGVTATSTHGSGLKFGPLLEVIESFELVAGNGNIFSVEKSGGITNRQAYKAKFPKRTLIQDDDTYHALGVAMGSMGIIYSVILRVTQAFWLKETRVLSSWENVKKDLVKGDVLKLEHYELLLNPYKVNGMRQCLVTTRTAIPKPLHPSPIPPHRNVLNELLSSLPIGEVLRVWMDLNPELVPGQIDGVLKSMVEKNYTNKSFNVFNIGAANNVASYSAEIGFPLTNNLYVEGIENIFAIAEQARKDGNIVHSGLIAVRFVKGSGFLLSPQYGNDTAMAELIFVKDTIGCKELLYRYETESYRFQGRPHWGQMNTMTGSKGLVAHLYPKLDAWLKARSQFDPNGTFESPFTKRVGLGRGPVVI